MEVFHCGTSEDLVLLVKDTLDLSDATVCLENFEICIGFEWLAPEIRTRRMEGTGDTYKRMLGKLKLYAEYRARL